MGDFEEQYPRYPKNKGDLLLDVVAGCSADALFKLMWGPSTEYMAKANEARGNKDYRETPWCSSEQELSGAYSEVCSAAAAKAPASTSLTPGEHAGRMRRTVCSCTGMGMKYKTEEVQRCVRAEEGIGYEVEVCVATTATYGDRFRALFKYSIEAIDPKSSSLKAEYQLVYIGSVNGFLKKAIERGASSGITKNFETLRGVMSQLVDIQKPSAGEPAGPSHAVQAPAQVAVASRPSPQTPLWYLGAIDDRVLSVTDPLAQWLHRQLGQSGPTRSQLAFALAVCSLTLALSFSILVLQGVQEACLTGSGWAARMCSVALRSLDLPQSTRSIVSGMLLLVGARTLLLQARAAITWACGCLGLAPPPPPATESDTPQKGVRFDGFEAALETASASIADTVEDLASPPPAAKAPAVDASGSSASKQADKAVNQFKAGMQGIKRYVSEQWKVSPVKPTASAAPVATSPPQHRRSATMGASEAIAAEAQPTSPVASSQEGQTAGQAEENPSSSGLPVEATSSNALSRVRVRRGLTTGQISPLLEKTKDRLATFGLGPRTSPIPVPGGPPSAASLEVSPISFADGEDMSLAAAELSMTSPREETSTEDMEAVATGPLQEEVFENERLQPFIGWGHNWPGHFLPTDRVGHWGDRYGKPGARESMAFETVAPQLPKGWKWVENDWQIDLTGLVDSSVDEEGWTYGMDFNWLRVPPLSGAGKKKVRDFVRRRRWIRTRVRDGLASVGSAEFAALSMSVPAPAPTPPVKATESEPMSLLSWAMGKQATPSASVEHTIAAANVPTELAAAASQPGSASPAQLPTAAEHAAGREPHTSEPAVAPGRGHQLAVAPGRGHQLSDAAALLGPPAGVATGTGSLQQQSLPLPVTNELRSSAGEPGIAAAPADVSGGEATIQRPSPDQRGPALPVELLNAVADVGAALSFGVDNMQPPGASDTADVSAEHEHTPADALVAGVPGTTVGDRLPIPAAVVAQAHMQHSSPVPPSTADAQVNFAAGALADMLSLSDEAAHRNVTTHVNQEHLSG